MRTSRAAFQGSSTGVPMQAAKVTSALPWTTAASIKGTTMLVLMPFPVTNIARVATMCIDSIFWIAATAILGG